VRHSCRRLQRRPPSRPAARQRGQRLKSCRRQPPFPRLPPPAWPRARRPEPTCAGSCGRSIKVERKRGETVCTREHAAGGRARPHPPATTPRARPAPTTHRRSPRPPSDDSSAGSSTSPARAPAPAVAHAASCASERSSRHVREKAAALTPALPRACENARGGSRGRAAVSAHVSRPCGTHATTTLPGWLHAPWRPPP
jgi:hypothetical protein